MTLPVDLYLWLRSLSRPRDGGTADRIARGATALADNTADEGSASVWLWPDSVAAASGLCALAERLAAAGVAGRICISCPEGLPPGPIDAVAPVACPDLEQEDEIAAALDRVRPKVIVLAGTVLPARLVRAAARRGIAVLFVASAPPRLDGAPRRKGWRGALSWVFGWLLRDVERDLLGACRMILARDEATRRALVDAGIPEERAEHSGPLEEPLHTPGFTEAERASLARLLGTRPIWLALGLSEAEEEIVALAHLEALRVAHRLLLVVVPDDPPRGAALGAGLAARHGLEVALRSQDQDPDAEVQVYVADTEGEDGLWLRLAPIVWMGGTLDPGAVVGRHPFAAASLGAAIIHGPHTAPYEDPFRRIDNAGGARAVADTRELAEALGLLLGADEAARLAAAAWDVSSQGAAGTERAIAIVQQLLAEAGP
jgi:3-deoxy-D-manno-octulosonic-acid transferase